MLKLTLYLCVVCLAELAGNYSDGYDGWSPDTPGLDYMIDRREVLCDGCGHVLV